MKKQHLGGDVDGLDCATSMPATTQRRRTASGLIAGQTLPRR